MLDTYHTRTCNWGYWLYFEPSCYKTPPKWYHDVVLNEYKPPITLLRTARKNVKSICLERWWFVPRLTTSCDFFVLKPNNLTNGHKIGQQKRSRHLAIFNSICPGPGRKMNSLKCFEKQSSSWLRLFAWSVKDSTLVSIKSSQDEHQNTYCWRRIP